MLRLDLSHKALSEKDKHPQIGHYIYAEGQIRIDKFTYLYILLKLNRPLPMGQNAPFRWYQR